MIGTQLRSVVRVEVRDGAPAGARAEGESVTPVTGLANRQRPLNLLLASLVLMAFALAWDTAAYKNLSVHSPQALQALESKDWYRVLRVLGTLWPWALTALVFVLVDWPLGSARRVLRRAVVLLSSAAGAGAAAEVLKLLVGRLRPNQSDGVYEFVPFMSRLWPPDSSNLGMPSSHAAVAFGAAFALSFMYPRATWVFVPMAIGCGLTRVVSGAHYLSDAYVGLLVAFGAAWCVHWLDRRNNVVKPAAPEGTRHAA